MKVKDLIKKLLELPLDAEIGVASYDENDELWGEERVDICNTKEVNQHKIQKGDKNLDYYLI